MGSLNIFVNIWDYRDQVSSINQAIGILSYFFGLTTIVAMLVSFFSLNSSMYTNIHEQTKEIGIIRSLGISKFGLYRIFIYEALVLVLASSLSGIFIGCFVGYTMTIQQLLFTQLPVPFVFPTSILITVAITSLIFATLASAIPLRNTLSNSIVSNMRYIE